MTEPMIQYRILNHINDWRVGDYCPLCHLILLDAVLDELPVDPLIIGMLCCPNCRVYYRHVDTIDND